MQRKVFRVSGTDRHKFLQGLLTNDVRKTDSGLVYAALLTPQGKYICDFFLSNDGESILLDLPQSDADAVVARLNMYRLRADVQIEATDLIVSTGRSDDAHLAPKGALDDPRHEAMGWRLYSDTDQSIPLDWDEIRVTHCIPQHGIELTSDTFILEAGFERLNGVDFKKGCYVGQEVTARMKHKTELRKGYMRVAITEQVDIGTQIVTNAGKDAGTVFTQSNGFAIAYARFDRLEGTLSAGPAQITVPE
jgi:hypothetical protein